MGSGIILYASLIALVVITEVHEIHGGHLVERMSMKDRWIKQTKVTSYRFIHKQSHADHVKKAEDSNILMLNGSLESDVNDTGEEVRFVKEVQQINDTDDARIVEFVNEEEWVKEEDNDANKITIINEVDQVGSSEEEIDKVSVDSAEGLHHSKLHHYDDLNTISQDDNAVETATINVETYKPVFTTDDRFLSFTFDYSMLAKKTWVEFNLTSVRLITLMEGLSPAILRIGGTSSAFMFFDADEKHLEAAALQPKPVILTKDILLKFLNLVKASGNRFLIDLNIGLRLGSQWNPGDALNLFEFLSSQGFGDIVDWELGNEPEYDTKPGQQLLEPTQVANDFLILDRVVRSYTEFNTSRVVGPDVVNIGKGGLGYSILQATANIAGNILHALTFHHYYFDGKTATYKDYINSSHFPYLASSINNMKSLIASSQHPKLSLWIGETSTGYNSGTPNVSDRFVAGFLWLDKLGLSARMGVGVVMRQTFHGGFYSLVNDYLQPNPDYWLSVLYKQLVGNQVLNVVINGVAFSEHLAGDNTTVASTTRVYAHCTRVSNNNITPAYPRGSVTLYALNLNPTSPVSLVLPPQWAKPSTDIYLLTPGDGDILSREVRVNGVMMKITSDTSLPTMKPTPLRSDQPFVLPPLSIVFLVVPEASATACL